MPLISADRIVALRTDSVVRPVRAFLPTLCFIEQPSIVRRQFRQDEQEYGASEEQQKEQNRPVGQRELGDDQILGTAVACRHECHWPALTEPVDDAFSQAAIADATMQS